MLEKANDLVGEGGADVSVDDAMVEAEREQHDLADDDLSVAHHGLLLHLVHAENADLGKVQDRRGEEAALLPERGDGEGRALQIFELDLALARVVREPLDLGGEAEQRAPVGVFEHGHGEARLGRGGDADVVVAAPNDLVRRLVEGAVQVGVALERGDDGLDDEGQEVELDALRLSPGLEPLAQIAQGGHVALFDEREVRGRLLRAGHLVEDLLAHALERGALFERLGRGRGRLQRDRLARRLRRGGGRVGSLGRRVGGRGGRVVTVFGGAAHRTDVVFGDAVVRAGGRHAAQVDAEIACELAGGGCGERLLGEVAAAAVAVRHGARGLGAGREVHAREVFANVADGGRGVARGRGLADRGRGGGGGRGDGGGRRGGSGRGLRRGRLRTAGRVGVEHDEVRADGDDLTDLAAEFEDLPRPRARDGHGRLVGHHLGEGLVGLDDDADVDALGPGDDLALGHALADVG